MNDWLTFNYIVDAFYEKKNDYVKNHMDYGVEGVRSRGRPKKTWREAVEKDCWTRQLNKEDAVDRDKCRKLAKLTE